MSIFLCMNLFTDILYYYSIIFILHSSNRSTLLHIIITCTRIYLVFPHIMFEYQTLYLFVRAIAIAERISIRRIPHE